MIMIVKDYLYCLQTPTSNQPSYHKVISDSSITSNNDATPINNLYHVVKEFSFEDSIHGKSINTLIDLNDKTFLVTTGERGKVLIDKETFEVLDYKSDFGFYVTAKINSKLYCVVNTETEGRLFHTDFELKELVLVTMPENERHHGWVSKIVQLSSNRFATASGDSTVKIWEINNDNDSSSNQVKLVKTLKKHTKDVITILKIATKDILISCSYDNKLIILDLRTFSVMKELDGIHPCFINGIKKLPNDRIIISEDKQSTVVNFITGVVLKTIPTEVNACCYEIIRDILLIECFDGSYLEMNMDNYHLKVMNAKEPNYITSMMNLSNIILVVGLHNGIVKIYKF